MAGKFIGKLGAQWFPFISAFFFGGRGARVCALALECIFYSLLFVYVVFID